MSRGRPKRSIRDLSRDPPHFEDHQEIRRLQKEGPDMVLAITAAALLEHEIEQLIIARLKRRDAGTVLKLTESNGPLAGLYAKAVLAYAMGVLDEAMLENINIVRLIRNAFAHAKRPIKFTAPEVIAELGKIRLPTQKRSQLYRDLHILKTKVSVPRTSFRMLSGRIRLYLMDKGSLGVRRKAARLLRKAGQSGLGAAQSYNFLSGKGLINRAPSEEISYAEAIARLAQALPPDEK